MKSKMTIERHLYSKEVPILTIILNPSETRDLYTALTNSTRMNSRDVYRQLEEFLSEYDSGKYDKLTLVEEGN